ncbi:MAG: LicD family protein [Lachnospiraceae bacterium]|nr:LicD family protein [Lachnospiraceae bacterium]
MISKPDYFKSAKEAYTEMFASYRLSDIQLKSLQQCLLSMLKDFKRICDEHGIAYMLGYGTLLGAVRHQGFIPWDDDIDVMMLREEFEKFRQVFDEERREGRLDDYLLAIPAESENYYFKIPKLYKKGTVYETVSYMGNPEYNMVPLDIFIVEKIPQNAFVRYARGLVYTFAYYASSFCLDHLYPSPAIREESRKNRKLRSYYRFRNFWGVVFSCLGGIGFYLKICDRLGRYSGKTKLRGIPSDVSYFHITYPAEMFIERTQTDFCGLMADIPKQYDRFLADEFGDYMKLPPEDKREVHVAYRLLVDPFGENA